MLNTKNKTSSVRGWHWSYKYERGFGWIKVYSPVLLQSFPQDNQKVRSFVGAYAYEIPLVQDDTKKADEEVKNTESPQGRLVIVEGFSNWSWLFHSTHVFNLSGWRRIDSSVSNEPCWNLQIFCGLLDLGKAFCWQVSMVTFYAFNTMEWNSYLPSLYSLFSVLTWSLYISSKWSTCLHNTVFTQIFTQAPHLPPPPPPPPPTCPRLTTYPRKSPLHPLPTIHPVSPLVSPSRTPQGTSPGTLLLRPRPRPPQLPHLHPMQLQPTQRNLSVPTCFKSLTMLEVQVTSVWRAVWPRATQQWTLAASRDSWSLCIESRLVDILREERM